MSAAEVLLAHLDRVKQTGSNRWIACCPAHDDKSPSLSIRETDDGRILIYDFAGCSAADVMAAVSMTLADLYPEKLSDHLPSYRSRKHHHAAVTALKAIKFEVLLVAIGAENIARGVKLEKPDLDRLWEAVVRIRDIVEVVV